MSLALTRIGPLGSLTWWRKLQGSQQYSRPSLELGTGGPQRRRACREHMIVSAYAQKGMFTEAFAELRKWREIAETPWNWGIEAYVQELLRRVGLAN